ncbi:MAG: hypothetical protein ABI462_07285 [Ignavibacteria bacterium]
MLSTFLRSFLNFFSKRSHNYYGACTKCSCAAYQDAGNSYCACGHSYDDHAG